MAIRTTPVTGTSRPAGLGFAVARELAEQGYHVILTARDHSTAESPAARPHRDGHPPRVATCTQSPVSVASVPAAALTCVNTQRPKGSDSPWKPTVARPAPDDSSCERPNSRCLS